MVKVKWYEAPFQKPLSGLTCNMAKRRTQPSRIREFERYTAEIE